jgi:hypothetical protein
MNQSHVDGRRGGTGEADKRLINPFMKKIFSGKFSGKPMEYLPKITAS